MIATAGPDNRMVGYPYTKLMNSNNAVEQSAALILTSVERAESLGVDRDRWVFPLAGTDAHDHVYVSERADLHSSPAIRHASRACLDLGGVGVDDLAHVDLYSCFPSAVQIGANEIGLSLDRQLTVTGGLSFAGGPWNNYVMHAIATMADVLRADPGSIGLCTANGGYTTKHAFGLYSTEPAAEGFRHASPRIAVDALPVARSPPTTSGPATLESHTVMHDRESRPEIAIAAVLTPEGGRGWATSTDDDVKAALVGNDLIGTSVTVDADGALPALRCGQSLRFWWRSLAFMSAMTRRLALGISSSSVRKCSVSNDSSFMSVTALTDADRGRWSMIAISPTVEPDSRVAT